MGGDYGNIQNIRTGNFKALQNPLSVLSQVGCMSWGGVWRLRTWTALSAAPQFGAPTLPLYTSPSAASPAWALETSVQTPTLRRSSPSAPCSLGVCKNTPSTRHVTNWINESRWLLLLLLLHTSQNATNTKVKTEEKQDWVRKHI